MKLYRLIVLLAILFAGASAFRRAKEKKVVSCYVASWAFYRDSVGKFDTADLRPELCTHVVYAFARLDPVTWNIKPHDPWRDIEMGGSGNYGAMTNLRKYHPELKVSLAIGGWNEGSKNYSELVANPYRRRSFVSSVVDYVKKYKFDGFDLDWEFPTKRGGVPADKANFVLLVQELRKGLPKDNLLTAAISGDKQTITDGYDIPELSKYLDYIHIMAYDYHGTWDKKVLPNAPLGSTDGVGVEDTVRHLLVLGAPPDKLVLGLAMYGRTFILKTKLGSEMESPVDKPCDEKGFQGPFTKQDNFMGYNEICSELLLNSDSWKVGWDNATSTRYATQNGDRVIMYDDPDSMVAKINFATELNLAGVMVWSIDTDDFRGNCAPLYSKVLGPLPEYDYPLMRTINMALGNDINVGTTTVDDNTSSWTTKGSDGTTKVSGGTTKDSDGTTKDSDRTTKDSGSTTEDPDDDDGGVGRFECNFALFMLSLFVSYL